MIRLQQYMDLPLLNNNPAAANFSHYPWHTPGDGRLPIDYLDHDWRLSEAP